MYHLVVKDYSNQMLVFETVSVAIPSENDFIRWNDRKYKVIHRIFNYKEMTDLHSVNTPRYAQLLEVEIFI